ncbi:OLC1v1018288C1 [Oldenlandia corymbosa var. corymbosa]|uniref:OLC1v1018288C1 n=1 Tax=Oldenlandia corymbosa var. corymbosa TaxID=529605 RepID=A0AAV1EBA6_OLDCO|nr:OLC1v1018288C1 [Oldenlandia corymbosa var. corymbosa]
MDPFALVAVKFKEFGNFTQDVVDGIFRWQQNFNRRKPIEILKRLQREAFSDIMKLRDRQDKVERMLSFYNSSKGNLFQGASTQVRGSMDMVGAMFLMDSTDDQRVKMIETSGIQTGLDLRLVFETTIRQKDMLVAECLADGKFQNSIVERPLSLSRVLYAANVSDWFSAVAIPLGARCKDLGVAMTSSIEEKGFSEYSAYAPSFLNQKNGCALGVMVKKSNIVASLGQFVSELGSQQTSGTARCFSTFGQVVYQLTQGTKLSVLGLHKMPKLATQRLNLGAMTLPVGSLRPSNSERAVELDYDLEVGTSKKEDLLDGSLALMIESELDETTRIGGWIEIKRANNRHLQWAVTMSDIPEDDIGWGINLRGLLQGPRSWDHFQAEAFVNFSLSERFRVQPTVVYLADGNSHIPGIMLRSSWSL